MRNTKATNPLLKGLIQELRKKANEHGANIWKRLADDLSKPTRQRRIVNLYKINKYTKDNETVVVPGKVLGYGNIDKKIIVTAFKFSKEAERKIKNLNGECMTIEELLKKNPKGSKLRIFG